MATPIAECEYCRREFVPRRAGHVFCSDPCRYRARSSHEQRPPVDRDAIDRLFDPRRDPDERVRDDDWSPFDDPEVRWIYSVETVAARRRGYLNLVRLGRV